MSQVNITNARSKVKSGLDHEITDLYSQLMTLPCINFLHLMASEIYSPNNILKVKVTPAR